MRILVGTILSALCAQTLLALDFGADYPVLPPQPDGKGFYAGLAEQYTHFGNTQPDIVNHNTGQQADSDSQYLNTLTSEPFLGYNFNERIGVELELPVIYRESQFIALGGAVHPFFRIHRTDWGMGDIRLQGHLAVIKKETPGYTLTWNLSAGIKFPTGDSSALDRFGLVSNSVGGPDLALGSGSYDGLAGTDILLRRNRLFLTAETQYAIRSEGDFNYQYANNLSWYGGPGIYLLTKDDYSLSVQAIVSGDSKGKDTFEIFGRNIHLTGTSETGVYLGPQINFIWRDRIVAQLGADLPVSTQTDGVQIVPTYRIHVAATWRF